MQTYEADMIDTADSKIGDAKCDICYKKIISSKYITAYILKSIVPEYKDSDVDTIMNLIGKIDISKYTVDMDVLPDKYVSPVIVSEGIEDNSMTDGKRLYDIRFTARTPQNREIALIINIEIQNDVQGYHLIRRAEYYCARLISSQYRTVFKGSDFDKIQKVYSIWICTCPDTKCENTISLYKMHREKLIGNYKDTEEEKRLYDIMNIIMVYLGNSETKECGGIIRMLYTLLSSKLPPNEKKRIVNSEFGVPITEELDKEVMELSNLSAYYVMEGIDKGKAEHEKKTVINMRNLKIPVDIIAKSVDLSIPEVEKIISENSGNENLTDAGR